MFTLVVELFIDIVGLRMVYFFREFHSKLKACSNLNTNTSNQLLLLLMGTIDKRNYRELGLLNSFINCRHLSMCISIATT